eukprot:8788749-Pyramimonas_sp.AAC.1
MGVSHLIRKFMSFRRFPFPTTDFFTAPSKQGSGSSTTASFPVLVDTTRFRMVPLTRPTEAQGDEAVDNGPVFARFDPQTCEEF